MDAWLLFNVPHPAGLLATYLGIAAGVLIAACWPRFAGTLGLLTGALLVLVIEVGRGNVYLLPPAYVIERVWAQGGLVGEMVICGLAAVIARGFFSGRLQRWWRLL